MFFGGLQLKRPTGKRGGAGASPKRKQSKEKKRKHKVKGKGKVTAIANEEGKGAGDFWSALESKGGVMSPYSMLKQQGRLKKQETVLRPVHSQHRQAAPPSKPTTAVADTQGENFFDSLRRRLSPRSGKKHDGAAEEEPARPTTPPGATQLSPYSMLKRSGQVRDAGMPAEALAHGFRLGKLSPEMEKKLKPSLVETTDSAMSPKMDPGEIMDAINSELEQRLGKGEESKPRTDLPKATGAAAEAQAKAPSAAAVLRSNPPPKIILAKDPYANIKSLRAEQTVVEPVHIKPKSMEEIEAECKALIDFENMDDETLEEKLIRATAIVNRITQQREKSIEKFKQIQKERKKMEADFAEQVGSDQAMVAEAKQMTFRVQRAAFKVQELIKQQKEIKAKMDALRAENAKLRKRAKDAGARRDEEKNQQKEMELQKTQRVAMQTEQMMKSMDIDFQDSSRDELIGYIKHIHGVYKQAKEDAARTNGALRRARESCERFMDTKITELLSNPETTQDAGQKILLAVRQRLKDVEDDSRELGKVLKERLRRSEAEACEHYVSFRAMARKVHEFKARTARK